MSTPSESLSEAGIRGTKAKAPKPAKPKVPKPEKPKSPLPADGDPVRTSHLQNRLNSLGKSLVVDGHFGPKTAEALRDFQVAQGLSGDGEVGEKTTAFLRAPKVLPAEEVPVAGEPDGESEDDYGVLFKGLGVGEKEPHLEVADLQDALGDLGYAVESDGRFGPQTDGAVRRMQRKFGLKTDGIVGPKTHRTMAGAAARAHSKESAVKPKNELAEAADSMMKASTHKKGLESKKGDRDNWVERTGSGGKGGQLPAYIQHIALALVRKRGMPKSQAIAIAIGQVKKWAAGGGGVDAGTKAAAAKALGEWEAMKAKNKAKNISEAMLIQEAAAADWGVWEGADMTWEWSRDRSKKRRVWTEAGVKKHGTWMRALEESKAPWMKGKDDSKGEGMKRCSSCGWRNAKGKTKCAKCKADLAKKGDAKLEEAQRGGSRRAIHRLPDGHFAPRGTGQVLSADTHDPTERGAAVQRAREDATFVKEREFAARRAQLRAEHDAHEAKRPKPENYPRTAEGVGKYVTDHSNWSGNNVSQIGFPEHFGSDAVHQAYLQKKIRSTDNGFGYGSTEGYEPVDVHDENVRGGVVTEWHKKEAPKDAPTSAKARARRVADKVSTASPTRMEGIDRLQLVKHSKPLESDTKLFHGSHGDFLKGEVGDEVKLSRSTSFTKQQAFARAHGHDTVYHFDTPAGTKTFRPSEINGVFPAEEEHVMLKNTKVKITKKERRDGQLHVHATVVPRSSKLSEAEVDDLNRDLRLWLVEAVQEGRLARQELVESVHRLLGGER